MGAGGVGAVAAAVARTASKVAWNIMTQSIGACKWKHAVTPKDGER
jgi:hypothetical protein